MAHLKDLPPSRAYIEGRTPSTGLAWDFQQLAEGILSRDNVDELYEECTNEMVRRIYHPCTCPCLRDRLQVKKMYPNDPTINQLGFPEKYAELQKARQIASADAANCH